MEACIEALFNIEGENGRRKTIEMIRVLKGAISVSKSKTGEVIYHYNRHEKKALRRKLAKYDNDTRRSRLDIEQQKRDILRKWSLVFGRQRTFCESIRVFDDMLAEAIILRDKLKDEHNDDSEDEDAEPELTDEEKARLEEEERKKNSIPLIEDPRKRRLQTKLNPAIAKPNVPATTTGMLPKINMNATLFGGRIETEEEEKARLEREAEEERKRKAKELPRFDKELVKDFLKEQRHMHEDLLTRNALMKIRSQADNDHIFFKYRMRTKLPMNAHSLLHHIENDRPVTEMENRSLTRQSNRSEAGTRPTTRGDSSIRGGTRPDTRQGGWTDGKQTARPITNSGARSVARLPSRQGPRRLQRASTSEAGTGISMVHEPLTARMTQTADPNMPKLDRAKTVHFS